MTDPRIEAAARAIFEYAHQCEGDSVEWHETTEALRGVARRYALQALAAADAAAWRPMIDAPRNRTDILARTRPDVYPEAHNRSGWNNRSVVIRHEGILNDGFDMGWSVAAPVGYGGMPDEWFVGWQPLPTPPASIAELGGVEE